ncbi:MAG: hypothetical protein OEV87_06640 [Phycisphaerae bacterium]|nr:hypothetical protein [Phycisphaerae bacterium]
MGYIKKEIKAKGLIRRRDSFLLILLLISCGMKTFASDEKSSKQMSDYKIRGGFMSSSDMELLQDMSLNGLNTVLVKFQRIKAPMTIQERLLISKWSQVCGEAGLQFLPTMNFWSVGEREWFTPRFHYVTDGREYIKTPCPLEWNTYKRSIHDRLIEFAKFSKTTYIAGVIFNTELFVSEFNLYFQVCHCDNCWGKFREVYEEYPGIPIGQRQKYLKKKGATRLYHDFAVDRLITMGQLTRQQVDKTNPSFVIGFGGLDIPTFFHQGLAKGFGGGRNPVYIFSRATYQKGYSGAIKETIANFKRKNINVRFVAGLWQDKFPIENLPEQYYYCAKESNGYWIYTMQSLNPDWKQPLVAGRNDYWHAIKKANTELDKLVQNPNYKTNLKIQAFEPPLTPVNTESIKVELLRHVCPNASFETDIEPLKMRGVNKLVFIANKGDLIRFRVQFDQRLRRFSKVKKAEVTLLTNEGQILTKKNATKDQVAALKIVAPYAGSYCIVLNSDSGTSLQVISFTHPYSIEAPKNADLHLVWPVSDLYLYKPSGRKIPKLSVAVGNTSEVVKAVFSTESGNRIAEHVIKGKQIINLSGRNGFIEEVIILSFPEQPWRHKPHILIAVQDGLGKYISPYKAGLVKY